MTAILAHQSRETPARPASGQALPGEFVLQDGTPALIWPLLPTDAETLRDVFRRPSPGSRHHRFLQVLDQLDDPMIRQLPQAGLIPAVERYLEFVQRMAELNRDLTVMWVQAASAMSGVACGQVPVGGRPGQPGAGR